MKKKTQIFTVIKVVAVVVGRLKERAAEVDVPVENESPIELDANVGEEVVDADEDANDSTKDVDEGAVDGEDGGKLGEMSEKSKETEETYEHEHSCDVHVPGLFCVEVDHFEEKVEDGDRSIEFVGKFSPVAREPRSEHLEEHLHHVHHGERQLEPRKPLEV